MGTQRGWGSFLKSRSYAQEPTGAATDQGKEFNSSRSYCTGICRRLPTRCARLLLPLGRTSSSAWHGLFTWYWHVDLCAREGIPFVLGHALYMKSIHGGEAKHEKIDAHTIAVLPHGGMLLQASVYPQRGVRPARPLTALHVSHTQTGGAAGAHPDHQEPV